MATPKKPAAKSAKKSKAPVKSAKKAAPIKKAVAGKKSAKAKPAPKTTTKKANSVKKAAPVKKNVTAKAAPKKKVAVPAKKATVAKKTSSPNKKADLKKGTSVKKATNTKTIPAKKAPAKKAAAPAKKTAAPVKKVAEKTPAKKAAPVKKETVIAKKAVTAPKPAAKPAPKTEPKVVAKPAPKAEPAKINKAASASKKAAAKTPVKTVTTFAKTAIPNRPSASAAARSSESTATRTPAPAPRPVREEKKPAVIIARRVLENKSKASDQGKTMINYQPEFTRSILDEPETVQGPVYRYSDEELAEFRDLIMNRLDAARKELIYLQGLITRKDEAGTEDTENRYMNMEDGSGAMEREQLAQLASRQIQFINHLEKALIRIENKTYGICRVTGKLIDKARLRAVPHATLSIEAKKTMSSNK